MINVINFRTTEGATSLRNILPKAGEIKNIKNMMKKKRQGKHCDIYFVFLHFAICSAKCAHASVTLVLDLTLAPITELQLTNNYSARHWQHVVLLVMIIGGIYFGVSRKQDILWIWYYSGSKCVIKRIIWFGARTNLQIFLASN